MDVRLNLSRRITNPDYRCRLDWGRRGARRAAARGDILVIVDVLSFSAVTATSLHHGGMIYPCTEKENVNVLARRIGGEAAVRRTDVPQKGRFSLSPLTYIDMESGTKVSIKSPNGATCSRLARKAPYVISGGLLNAQAVAGAVAEIIEKKSMAVTVIACGEREKSPGQDGPIRWAVEDYLGAGAVISFLQYAKSPDATVCESAYRMNRDNLDQILWECPSGLELREVGFGDDVIHSARLNIYDSVPMMFKHHFDHFRL